jgi:hypothetical protein
MLRTIALYVGCSFLLVGAGGCGSASKNSTVSQSPNISVSPTSAAVGSAEVTLTVTGSAFSNDPHNKSTVVFDAGSETVLSTTFISGSQLTAVVPADLMVNPVTADIFVETGDPMGSGPFAKSDKVVFSVVRELAALTISSVSPATALAGSPDLMITITGTGFQNNATHFRTWVVFIFNDLSQHNLTTTFVSSTQLTAVIPATLMANPVSANIEVLQGDPMSDTPLPQSNIIPFNVTSQ